MSEIKVDIKVKKDHDQSAAETDRLKITGSDDSDAENITSDSNKSGQEEIEYLEVNPAEKLAGKESEQSESPKLEEAISDQDKIIARLESELEARDKEISELKSQIDELKDKFLRVLADMDNLRKRTAREKDEFRQYALGDVLKELLPIIDNFERALRVAEEANGKTFREGIELIYRMMLNFLTKHGVKPIELQDNRFDPSLHHALTSEESEEVSEPQIKEELQKGYLIHDRLLRPTIVKVLVPKKN
ncbi:MAG TPA: nucleotide exchange factor GrpE [Candidatus Saccharicenans sp.]|jgi:molecular chaperone GrpE|nr:nucleotide exchange factor GrpE [Candidatus Saccharicenans sp.]HRD01088.1 nucleotide exchange factor GrpE [Candidatus Saccharicenans sp.]